MQVEVKDVEDAMADEEEGQVRVAEEVGMVDIEGVDVEEGWRDHGGRVLCAEAIILPVRVSTE